jgi:prepilin-type N-terminal cleavage/methylation domain-containing protein
MRCLSKRPMGTVSSFCAAGFTLLEALVVLAVLGVLVSLAAPTVTGLYAKHQLQAQAEGLLDSLVLARSEAPPAAHHPVPLIRSAMRFKCRVASGLVGFCRCGPQRPAR